MATINECLKQLPPDMLMRDHIEIGEKTSYTVKELLERRRGDEEGYKIVERKYNYGKVTKKAIITEWQSMTLYSEW